MDLILFISIHCFIFGAAIGSFLSVCAYRIPMGRYEPIHDNVKELPHPVSILKPARSFCPDCQKQLLWWHNIPIVSWFLLRGRCAFCSKPISFRYTFIEISTAALCTLCYWRYGLTLTALAAFVFACALVVITFIDLDYMIIPDVITYPGTLLGLLIALANELFVPPSAQLLEPPFVASASAALLGLAAGPGLLLSIYYFYLIVRKREGIGLGDVKLLAVIGATFGMDGALSTIFVGSIIGAVVGVSLIAVGRGKFSQYIPFGPYLAAAALLYIFDGQVVLEWLAGVEPSASWWITHQ
jgi:leader peptidase (prepilin peptidase)/N-methyltransferase